MLETEKQISIAMVDDHILLRDALASIINGFDNCKVTLLAQHGRELINQLASYPAPDILLLDVNMPEMGGYETAIWLKENYPNIRILALTMHETEFIMFRFLKLGVRGFLHKHIRSAELEKAIKTTMESGYYYSATTTVKLAKFLQNGDGNTNGVTTVTLTDAELQFLELASTEMTYKEISAKMKLSPRTIDNYRDSLFVKLHVKSRVGLVLFAIENSIARLIPGTQSH